MKYLLMIFLICSTSCMPTITEYMKVTDSNKSKLFLTSYDEFYDKTTYQHVNFRETYSNPLFGSSQFYRFNVYKIKTAVILSFGLTIYCSTLTDFNYIQIKIGDNITDFKNPQDCKKDYFTYDGKTRWSDNCNYGHQISLEALDLIIKNIDEKIQFRVVTDKGYLDTYTLTEIDKIAFKNTLELYELLSK